MTPAQIEILNAARGDFAEPARHALLLINYYGSIDKFDDGRSLRIMVEIAEDNIRYLTMMWASLIRDPATAEDWRNTFRDEVRSNALVRREYKRLLKQRRAAAGQPRQLRGRGAGCGWSRILRVA